MPIRITPTIKAMADTVEAANSEYATAGVHQHRLPEPPTDAMWSRIVIRQLQGLSIPEHPTGVVSVPVQVTIECAGYANPDLLLEAAHEAVRATLEAMKPETDYGDAYLEIMRSGRPTAALWTQDHGAYASAATYQLILL